VQNGEEVRTTFVSRRQDRNSRETPSVRYEVSEGCFVTVFDDGRVRFTIDPVKSGRKVHDRPHNDSNLPGGS
jgi:hypothetical protein